MQKWYLYSSMKRFLSANVLYPVSSPVIPDGILVLDGNGMVLDVIDPRINLESATALKSAGVVEYFDGILVPGFINAHCHLELSHLRGKISEGTGLPGFLKAVSQLRSDEDEIIIEAMKAADQEMSMQGIVGVGDISNRAVSLSVKQKSAIKYHTFVEVFDLHPDYAVERFEEAVRIQAAFRENGLSASVVPHAPYTVSERLLQLIGLHAEVAGDVWSMHHYETASEHDMFVSGTGELVSFLKGTGRYDEWMAKGVSSLNYTLPYLPANSPLLLVHNTYAGEADFNHAQALSNKVWWCLCPAANLYIEKRLPAVMEMVARNLKIVLGTDSLSSNIHLSILEEMKLLTGYFPSLSFEEILASATLQPTHFFGWDNMLGSFTVGKKPGVNLLFEEPFPQWHESVYRLTPTTQVRKIV